MASAMGTLMTRGAFLPEEVPASFVAWRWEPWNPTGTVIMSRHAGLQKSQLPPSSPAETTSPRVQPRKD
eukprot:3918266-Alexandrium_andersonii.AAC.1